MPATATDLLTASDAMAARSACQDLCENLGLWDKASDGATFETFQRLLCRLGWQGDATRLWAQLHAYVQTGGTAAGRGGGSPSSMLGLPAQQANGAAELEAEVAAAPHSYLLTAVDVVALYGSRGYDDADADAAQQELIQEVLRPEYQARAAAGAAGGLTFEGFVALVLGTAPASPPLGLPPALLDPAASSGEAFLTALEEAAAAHPAVAHPYLARLGGGAGGLPYPCLALLDFAGQYMAYDAGFTKLVQRVAAQLEDPAARAALAENLAEEAGAVDDAKRSQLAAEGVQAEWYEGIPHVQLFRRFAAAMQGQVPEADLAQLDSLPATAPGALEPGAAFSAAMASLVAGASPAAGAALMAAAVEGIVHRIYTPILQAIEAFTDLSPRERVFFPLHLVADEEHAEVLHAIASTYADDAAARQDMALAVAKALELRASLWQGLLQRALHMVPPLADHIKGAASPSSNGVNGTAFTSSSGTATANANGAANGAAHGISAADRAAAANGTAATNGTAISNGTAVDKQAAGIDAKQPTTQAIYNKAASKWVRKQPNCLSDFTAREPLFQLLGPMLEAAAPPGSGGARVLDIGCGEGYVARRLRNLGARQVVGLDTSDEMIRHAQAAEEAEQLGGLQFFHGDACAARAVLVPHLTQLGVLPPQHTGGGGTGLAPEGLFDLAVAVFVFNYVRVADMRRVMDEVFTLLKPGARFVFSVPHPAFPFIARQPGPPFFFDHSNAGGYFAGVDRLMEGRIFTLDGRELPVRCMHKTFTDYVSSLGAAGFQLEGVRELTVTPQLAHGERADFFAPLEGVPLHMAFIVAKPAVPPPQAVVPARELLWNGLLGEEELTLRVQQDAMEELAAVATRLAAQGVTPDSYTPGSAGPLPAVSRLGREIASRLFERHGAVLIKLDLEQLGLSPDGSGGDDELGERAVKLAYCILCTTVGTLRSDRGRLFEVRDRGLDVAGDNVLYSASRQAAGMHTDSTNKDVFPDAVALLCMRQATGAGGESLAVNACNVYLRVRDRLPAFLRYELERPIVRDLIGRGMGAEADEMAALGRSPVVMARRLRANRFPIYARNPCAGTLTFRYMRDWIESGHERAGLAVSPLLSLAMDLLDAELQSAATSAPLNRRLVPGEVLWLNNHVVAHARTAYTEDEEALAAGRKGRLLLRAWLMAGIGAVEA